MTDADHLGGVFSPVAGKGQRPVYTMGPKMKKAGAGKPEDLVFQCPVSAIPQEVWDLLALWNGCRLTNSLPLAGGFMDQPEMVKRSFPIFSALQQGVEQNRHNPEMAAGLAIAAAFKAMGVGGR